MDFVARPPRHASLQGVVRSLWEARAPGAFGYETRLPSATTQLLINLAADHLHAFEVPALDERRRLPAAVVHGTHARLCGLDRVDQRAIVGIVFEPGTARVALGIPQDALADTHVGLDDVWGRGEGERLVEQLRAEPTPEARLDRAEAALVRRVAANGRSPDGLVCEALRRMHAGATEIGPIAATLGVTARRLRRRFCAELGLPPKPMVRVIRFARALDALASDLPLTDVALAAGYFDQAHLGHEFHSLSGMSPGRYRETRPAMRHHV